MLDQFMGAKSKGASQKIAHAFEHDANGKQVRALVKGYKISVPDIYLRITTAINTATASRQACQLGLAPESGASTASAPSDSKGYATLRGKSWPP
jgi:preprotein translocase subunit SecD